MPGIRAKTWIRPLVVARQVSEKGDKRALECLVTSFADLDWMVRHVALEASEQLLDDSLTSVLAVLGVLRNICQVIRDGDTVERNLKNVLPIPGAGTVKIARSVAALSYQCHLLLVVLLSRCMLTTEALRRVRVLQM